MTEPNAEIPPVFTRMFAAEAEELLATVAYTNVTVPSASMPPPGPDVAVLPLIVELRIVAGPLTDAPPSDPTELFPLIVEFVRMSAPLLTRKPPAASPELFPEIVEFVIVAAP